MAPTPEPMGVLFVVATPIGNLEDITYRAVRVLQEVDLVAAEDTRRTGQLLAHLGIRKPLLSFFEHNERARAGALVHRLARGENVALVSDGGTPAVSDPGFVLVRAAIEAGIRVVPVPGPCAAVTALVGSGLPTDCFQFVGFPPKRPGARRTFWSRLVAGPGPTVAYVNKRELGEALDWLVEAGHGALPVVMARELTKTFEEFLRGTAAAVRTQLVAREESGGPLKGEFTLLVGAAPPATLSDETLIAALRHARADGSSPSDAVRRVQAESGASRQRLYALLRGLE